MCGVGWLDSSPAAHPQETFSRAGVLEVWLALLTPRGFRYSSPLRAPVVMPLAAREAVHAAVGLLPPPLRLVARDVRRHGEARDLGPGAEHEADEEPGLRVRAVLPLPEVRPPSGVDEFRGLPGDEEPSGPATSRLG